jgi:hypothetical protein
MKLKITAKIDFYNQNNCKAEIQRVINGTAAMVVQINQFSELVCDGGYGGANHKDRFWTDREEDVITGTAASGSVEKRGCVFFLSRGFEREKMKRYCVEKRNAGFFLCFAFEPLIWFMSTFQSSVYGTGELEHRRNGADLNSQKCGPS